MAGPPRRSATTTAACFNALSRIAKKSRGSCRMEWDSPLVLSQGKLERHRRSFDYLRRYVVLLLSHVRMCHPPVGGRHGYKTGKRNRQNGTLQPHWGLRIEGYIVRGRRRGRSELDGSIGYRIMFEACTLTPCWQCSS